MSQYKSTILSLENELGARRHGPARRRPARTKARPLPSVVRAQSFDTGRVIELRYDGRVYAPAPRVSEQSGFDPARAAGEPATATFALDDQDSSLTYSVEDFEESPATARAVSDAAAYDGGRGRPRGRATPEARSVYAPPAEAFEAPPWSQASEDRGDDADEFEAKLRAALSGRKPDESGADKQPGGTSTAQSAPRANPHEIFDRLGQSMAYATTFDVGSVQLDTLFNDLDKSLERERPLPKAPATTTAPERPTPFALSRESTALSEAEVAADLAALGAQPRAARAPAPTLALALAPRPVIPVHSAPGGAFGMAQQVELRSETFGNTSTVADALTEIAAFRARTGTSRWRLNRADVATRLEELVNDPDKISQGKLNLCGPAATFCCWADRDPRAFARYAIGLYDSGVGFIGNYRVAPGDDLVNQDYAAVAARLTNWWEKCPTAEWMAMSALRDVANAFSDFEGTPEEDVAGLTTPAEVAEWMVHTGVYRTVRDEGNWVFTRPLNHAFGLMPTYNVDVILLINAHILVDAAVAGEKKSDEFILSAFPNHFVVLKTPLTRLPDGKVRFTCWSWARDYNVTLEPSIFQANYYGAITGEV